MRQNVSLTIASVLSVLLMTLHLADDIVRGFEKAGSALYAAPILILWLYGALMLSERRSGYVIVLLGSLVATLAPILHFRPTGAVARGEIGQSSGGFFFIWILIALSVTAPFSLVLSARELWRLGRGQAR
jgi:hypothetical protein